MLDVVRRTPAGTTNYTDEAPFIDNAGNNKALLVKGETDINTAINNLEQADIALDGKITKLNSALIAPANVNVTNTTTIVKSSTQIGDANGVIELPVSIPVSGNVGTMVFVSISGSIKFSDVTTVDNYTGNVKLTHVLDGSKIQVGGGSFACTKYGQFNQALDTSIGYFNVCGFIKMSSNTGVESVTLEFTDVDGHNSLWSSASHYDGNVTISINNVVKMPLPYTS